ncbi:uncharacterized protein TNCV_641391 [Trichonephila clavipes]|nr:uncharacterized protein TNCV_641391 [Trichonephila clavipes]
MDILQSQCCHSWNGSQEPFFNKTMLGGLTRQGCHKTVSALLLPFLDQPNFHICLQSSIFGMASWVSHEFERTGGKVTVNMERNVSGHHTELVCLSARSYCIVHSRLRGINMNPSLSCPEEGHGLSAVLNIDHIAMG